MKFIPAQKQWYIYLASVLGLFFFLLPLASTLEQVRFTTTTDITYVLSRYTPLLINTFFLALITACIASTWALFALIGVESISSRRIQLLCIFLLSLPLLFPPYIGAITYISLFKSPMLLQIFGAHKSTEWIQATFTLSLFLYPYIFLLLLSRVRMINPSHYKILSLYDVSFLRKLQLLYIPHLKTTLFSGALLVFIYVVADFGAVSILRMETLSISLYQEIVNKADYISSALISMLFILISLITLRINKYVTSPFAEAYKKPTKKINYIELPRLLQYLSLLLLGFLIIASVILPLATIMRWCIEYMYDSSYLKDVWTNTRGTILLPTTLSVILSLFVSLLASSLTCIIWYLRAKNSQHISSTIYAFPYILHSLPGIVITFSVVTIKQWFITIPPALFLLYAYLLRYIGVASISLDPAFKAIPQSAQRIGTMFISSKKQYLKSIILPYMKGPILQSTNYIFFNVLRELTIPLLLLPLGTELLSVRIWQTASEGLYTYAAPSMLLLILVSLPSVILYIRDQL